MTKAERAELLSGYLKNEGYAPTIDADGDVVFKYEGGTYAIILEEEDESFFRIVYPGFWSIENADERARVERASLAVSRDMKVVKVFPVGDNTWAAVELFCSSAQEFIAVFYRSLGALQSAVRRFADEVARDPAAATNGA